MSDETQDDFLEYDRDLGVYFDSNLRHRSTPPTIKVTIKKGRLAGRSTRLPGSWPVPRVGDTMWIQVGPDYIDEAALVHVMSVQHMVIDDYISVWVNQ